MPLSSSRRCIHHGDTAAGSMPVTGPQPEAQDPGAGLDRHRQRLALDGQRSDVGGIDEVEVVGVGDLAGHATHRKAVAAVRGDGEVEHGVVEAEHVGGGSARFGGARRQHEDSGVVGAEVQLGRRADHPVGRAAVRLARGDGEVAGQRGPGQRHHNQIADGEVGCTADDVARLGLTDVDLDRADRLLELGELLDLEDPADGQRTAHRADRDDLLDLVADADQRLLELVAGHVPAGRAGCDDLAQPAVGKPHQAPTPNGSENRTSPSTMSRMSGMPLRNCSVRSSPMPNANPE